MFFSSGDVIWFLWTFSTQFVVKSSFFNRNICVLNRNDQHNGLRRQCISQIDSTICIKHKNTQSKRKKLQKHGIYLHPYKKTNTNPQIEKASIPLFTDCIWIFFQNGKWRQTKRNTETEFGFWCVFIRLLMLLYYSREDWLQIYICFCACCARYVQIFVCKAAAHFAGSIHVCLIIDLMYTETDLHAERNSFSFWASQIVFLWWFLFLCYLW